MMFSGLVAYKPVAHKEGEVREKCEWVIFELVNSMENHLLPILK